MFPTAGYFRSTNCPFFVHGLCHRPYCHFRHCKPGVKTSKSKPSPHKNKISGHHDVSKRKETKECTSEGLSESDNKVAVSEVKTGENHSSCDENKYETKITEVKGILKRQTDEGNEGSISEDSANSLATRSVESRPLATKENNTEEFESDDTDQPIASLTEEEKQIIGLFSQTACGSDSVCEDKSSDVRYTASVEDVCSYDSSVKRNATLTKDGRVTSFNTSVSTNMPGIDDCDDVSSRDENEQDGTSIKREPVEVNCGGSADNTTPYSDAQEAIIEEMKTTSGQGGMSQTNDDLSNDKLFPKRRKSIQLKTALIDSSAKKRKSQQLLCVADPSSVNPVLKSEKESNKLDKILGNEDAIKCKSTLNKFLESKSKLWDKVKNMSTEEADSVNEEGSLSSPPKKQKLDHSDASPLKKKSPLKDLSVKKKVKLAEAEINFFDSTKKTSKGQKLEKSNNKEKKLSVRTTKVTNHQSKSKDFKRKFAKGVTILVSDDSDTLSPANCQSSSEEESHLKRIWDDFEPNIDIPEFEPELPPTRKTQAMDSTAKKVSQTTAPGTQPVNVKKPSSIVNTLGLGKKQRVAHTANHLPRRTSSNANPVRRYPKTLAATVKKDVPTTSSSTMESSVKSSLSFKPIKQRVAHVAKTSAATGSLPRPRIPVEYGAKVPQNQRQRYLDRIIDEYLRLCSTQKEAFEKAVEEETALYERSTRRQVYLNLCVNAIKKLRDMTPQDMAASLPEKAKTEKQLTKTVLPSGAVVISSKSPVKQTRPTSPNSGDLTEEVMYDFLLKYLMTEDDLVQNGFPRPCSSVAGKAVMKMKKEQSSRDPSRRICQRCGKPFVVLEDEVYQTKEECVYHAGKLFRKKGEQIRSYSCCQGDAGSPGCCVGQVHVSDEMHDTDGFMTTIVSPLADQRKKIFSMDCEMCYTTGGLELTRITVVNWNLEVVYDTFVMPERTIVDYNTRFSGVTAELLRGVTTTIREVQAVLLSMIHKDTILVGHSLESDLKATKLIHSKVVDTSVVFPHRLGAPYKRALRHLMADHLKKIIQDNVEGHDSFEDAKACLELMRWKVKEDVKKTTRHKTPRLSVG